jgi:hypothetical protein
VAKYGKGASKSVESAVRRQKHGTLKSGSGGRVRNRKQAIAIGLSEAREKGAKVPPRGRRAAKKRSGAAKKRSGAAKKRSSTRSTRSSSPARSSETRKARKTSKTRKTRGARKR